MQGVDIRHRKLYSVFRDDVTHHTYKKKLNTWILDRSSKGEKYWDCPKTGPLPLHRGVQEGVGVVPRSATGRNIQERGLACGPGSGDLVKICTYSNRHDLSTGVSHITTI